jgi:group I intron endonuclease
MRESGIYKITNMTRGKVYVGSAVDLRQRRFNHFSQLKRNKHANKKLQNAWNKYGASVFVFEVLELVEKHALAEREQHWMDTLNAVSQGYNIFPRARTSLDRKLSKETKEKLRAAQLGKPLSEEHRKALHAGARRPRIRSAEETARRAASATGKKHTEKTKQIIREKATGRSPDAATRAKLSAAGKGRPMSEASRRALAIAHTGAKRTDEAKAKMSAAQKLRFKTKPPARDENGKLTCSCDAARGAKLLRVCCRP